MKWLLTSLFFVLALAAAACTQQSAREEPTPTPSAPASSTSPPFLSPSAPSPHDEPLERDLLSLAVRLGRTAGPVSAVARDNPPAYQEGDRQEFTLLDVFAPSLNTITATLRLITPHAYFYFEEGLDVSQEEIEKAGQDFEEAVYPTIVPYFGPEWTPGVDSDPRITLLHADLSGLGGYFSDSDEYPRTASPPSNEREMLYLNGRINKPGSDGYKGLLAHELQHLVHWNADHGEEVWVNEGLSEVASELISGGLGSISAAVASPDTQLNAWEPMEGNNFPHYGASHLFFRYLLDRYGGLEGARRLVAEPADGIEGIDRYLAPFGVTFQDVFADWVVANYLDDPSGGPYSHADADVKVEPPLTLRDYDEGKASVHQFAADYIEVDLPEGDALFSFDGAEGVKAVPNEPHSGSGQWWSGRGDSIDSTLTAEFDLTGLEKATLRFWTWYNLEEDWDHGYVLASSDGGATWRILRGRHTTDKNPLGLAYGPTYTGKSGGGDSPAWVKESIDLSPFAGQKVLLRFEYITDGAINLEGWTIDDIAIPELGFFDDGESDGPWQPQGFRRLTAPLPQRFIVQVIEMGETTSVRPLPLDEANRGEVRLSGFGSTLDRAVIVIAAASEGTREVAPYAYSLRRA